MADDVKALAVAMVLHWALLIQTTMPRDHGGDCGEWGRCLNPPVSKGWVKLPPGRFLPRIFGTEKYAMVCFYDFS